MQSACTFTGQVNVYMGFLFAFLCACMQVCGLVLCFYLSVRVCVLFLSISVQQCVCLCMVWSAHASFRHQRALLMILPYNPPSPPSVQTNPDGSAQPETCQVITHVSDGNQYASRVYMAKNPFSISFMQFLKRVLIFKGFRGAFYEPA